MGVFRRLSFRSQNIYQKYIREKQEELTIPTSMISGEELVVNHMSPECMEFLHRVYESKYVNTKDQRLQTACLFFDIMSTRLVFYLIHLLGIHRYSYLYYSKGITLNDSVNPEIPKDLLKLISSYKSSDCKKPSKINTKIEYVNSRYLLKMENSTLHLNCESMLSIGFPIEIQKVTQNFELDICTKRDEIWTKPFFQDLFRHVLESEKKLSIRVDIQFADTLKKYLSDNFQGYSESIEITPYHVHTIYFQIH